MDARSTAVIELLETLGQNVRNMSVADCARCEGYISGTVDRNRQDNRNEQKCDDNE